MAEWQKECLNGKMAEMDTYVLFMVHADTDDDTDDNDTLIFYSIEVKNYEVTKMSVNIHSFAPLLLRRKEPQMHNQHCRLLIDTMKSLSPVARTLKPLRRPSNRWSH